MLACSSCHELVGTEQKRVGTLQLFKWALTLQRSRDSTWETYSVEEIVSAQLVAMIEDQAVSKFLVYSGNIEDAEVALLVRKIHCSASICSLKHNTSCGYSPPK